MVAMYLGIEQNEVFDCVLDDISQVTLLQDLLRENGRGAVMFYYQDGPPPPIGITFIIKR